MLVDFAVTGNPLFSIKYTSGSAEDLGRSRSLSEIPSVLPEFFVNIVKAPVLVAAFIGLAAALWLAPRRSGGPLLLLGAGIGTFLAIGAAGASIIERYLVVGALGLLVFAAFALGGWSLLEPGTTGRRWWAGLALAAVLGGATYTALNLNLRRFESELAFRGDAHDALEEVLRAPAVTAALRCGPLTLPNHKLVPDARWILDLPFERVRSRAQEDSEKYPVSPATGGVAVYATSRMSIFKHAWTDDADRATIQNPVPGWTPVARSAHYAAYARC
jgi:hypothetical protein